jgi:hypothetical protein
MTEANDATPPVIMTQWGQVTESARLQAATNMRLDHALRARVVALLAKQLGSEELGLKEAKRRYPESWEDE